jgi:O-antigen/teichoic acid export membrane protein
MNLKDRLFTLSTFWLNVSKLATGSILAQISGVLLSPVILRMFDAKDIGMLNLFNQVVAFFLVFSVLRLDRAIVLSKGTEAHRIIETGLSIILFFTLVIILATLPFSGFWFQVMNLDYPGLFILALPLAFVLQSTINLYKAAGNVFSLYSMMASAIVMQSVVVHLLKIFFGLSLGRGPAWLILAELSGYLLTFFYLLLALQKKADFRFRLARSSEIRELLSSKLAFIKYDVPAALLNYFSSSVAIFLLAWFYDTRVVGYYALGYSMLRLPMNLLGKAIGDVFYKDAADQSADPEKLRKSTSNVVIQLFTFGILPMAAIFFFGDVIFSFAFGKHWITAGKYSQIFSSWTLIWFISSPVSNLYYILKLQHRFTLVMFTSLLLRGGAIIAGAMFGDIWLTLILYSFVSILVYGYQVVFLLGKLHVNARNFIKNLWLSCRFAIVPLMIMVILNYVSPATPLMLLILIPVMGFAMLYRWIYKPRLNL